MIQAINSNVNVYNYLKIKLNVILDFKICDFFSVIKQEKHEFIQSNNYCFAENFDSHDSSNAGYAFILHLHYRLFVVA